MEHPNIVLITGLSGAGKTTLWQNLVSRHPDRLHKVITHTTRPPREGERNGHDYHFVTPEDFHALREKGHFLESSEHYGNHYGSAAPTSLGLPPEYIPLYVVDPNGALAITEAFPNTHAFFVAISPAEQLRRLKERTADEAAIAARLARYDQEMAMYEANKHRINLLINEEPQDLEKAIDTIRRSLAL